MPASFPPESEIATSLGEIRRDEWNAIVGPINPFYEYEFLSALEEGGSIAGETTWQPRFFLLRRAGRLIGAVPFYLKWDSYGEFIFDWQWADAYSRGGIPYYPKAVAAVPFTPVTGERLLVHPDEPWEETAGLLARGLLEHVRSEGLTGLHVLFPTLAEHDVLVGAGLMSRITHQFHWENRGYATFDDYLGDLRSKKRKSVRNERRQVAESGLVIEAFSGESIRDEHMEAMWKFYLSTIQKKWSQAYLTREVFERLLADFRHRLLLVLARDGDRWVAGTLNVFKGGRLFGRYWGALVDVPGLHFECCFYRLIDFAIEHSLDVVEAGAQGEHKFLRGFAARPTYSAHWLAHPGGSAAIGGFLEEESAHNREVIEGYNRVSPLKPLRAAAASTASETPERPD